LGIYNGIHTVDNDLYYYCPRNDCPCHHHYFYDASGNYDNAKYVDNSINDIHHNI